MHAYLPVLQICLPMILTSRLMELNSSELEERLNTDLENIHKWLIANKRTLNKQKTEYMMFALDSDYVMLYLIQKLNCMGG
jgi:hypothetical protein